MNPQALLLVGKLVLGGVNPNDHTSELAEVAASPTPIVQQVQASTPENTYSDVDDSPDSESEKDYALRKGDETAQLICDDQARIKMAENAIAHEKKVGKLTGTQNLKALHDAGSTLVMLKEREAKVNKMLPALKKSYKESTGKDFVINCQIDRE